MKYVFYDATIYSGLPLYTDEITGYVKDAVGSEMLPVYMKKFIENLKTMVEQVNEKKKAHMSVEYNVATHAYLKHKFGRVYVYKKRKPVPQLAAILFFIVVESMWAEDMARNEELRQFTFKEWDELKFRNDTNKMKKGGAV